MKSPPLGVYVHIPFCASRCNYCDFYTLVGMDSAQGRYAAALKREARRWASDGLEGREADSVFFGGGTPSWIAPAEIAGLLATLASVFALDPLAEVTLEANPQDVAAPAAGAWSAGGINRVSLGAQSFDERELEALSRRHRNTDVARAVAALRAAGIRRYSLDLMLGIPHQTAASLSASLAAAAESGAEHLSVYILEVYRDTELMDLRRRQPEIFPDPEATADLYEQATQELAAYGYERYEISNFAVEPAARSRHNLKYWQRRHTLGLGASAAGFVSGERVRNVRDLETYMKRIEAGDLAVAERTSIDGAEARREEIFLGLRLAAGMPRRRLLDLAAPGAEATVVAALAAGYIEETPAPSVLRLTARGAMVSTALLAEFI